MLTVRILLLQIILTKSATHVRPPAVKASSTKMRATKLVGAVALIATATCCTLHRGASWITGPTGYPADFSTTAIVFCIDSKLSLVVCTTKLAYLRFTAFE